MPRKIKYLKEYLKIFLGVGGGACPQTPLAARTFGARDLPRLALKSDYGSGGLPFCHLFNCILFYLNQATDLKRSTYFKRFKCANYFHSGKFRGGRG